MFGRLHRVNHLRWAVVGPLATLLRVGIINTRSESLDDQPEGRTPTMEGVSQSNDNLIGSNPKQNGVPQEFHHLLRDHNYPAWDYDWDKQHNHSTKCLTTRHILLVRHGQYEQQYNNDSQRILTPLGRLQAEYTGERLARMLHCTAKGNENDIHPSHCRLKAMHVSGMKRAQETADIIASHLKADHNVCFRTSPENLLNEGFPAPIIPIRHDLGSISSQASAIEESSERIEAAFQKYIHRSTNEDSDTDHEFEIIVCHANVIRYFLLRALQLPPEAWLRLSLFNCSISYLMILPDGTVSARMVGDTGHIPYSATTFSGSYGYNWKTPGST